MDINKLCLRCMREKPSANGVCPFCGKPAPVRQNNITDLPLQSIVHGRYLIGAEKGKGGFGITYAAYDLKEARRVVLKELFPALAVDRTAGETGIAVKKEYEEFFKVLRQRFVEEAQMIYSLSGVPQIVDVYHSFYENNTAYYSMEYLSGQNLKDLIPAKYNGRMPWQALKPVINDVAAALKVVHSKGAVHRDISPDNIFVLEDGRAKLIDFGAARQYGNGKRMTEILKKNFAPPEQYLSDGSKQGPWTDIYALAATIYKCLTGDVIPDAHARTNLPDPPAIKPFAAYGVALPARFEAAVMRALNTDAKKRQQTVAEFMSELGGESDAPPTPRTGEWTLNCVSGLYAGTRFPFDRTIVVGRDPGQCNIVFPVDAPGISRRHLTLLQGRGPAFPGIRCDSATQPTYINGIGFMGAGRVFKLNPGDRIAFGNNQIFLVERY